MRERERERDTDINMSEIIRTIESLLDVFQSIFFRDKKVSSLPSFTDYIHLTKANKFEFLHIFDLTRFLLIHTKELDR